MKGGLIGLTLFLLVTSHAAQATGAVYVKNPDKDLVPLNSFQQNIFLRHQDGVQEILVLTETDLEGMDSVYWFIPVSAPKDQVKIDFTNDFPSLNGREINSQTAYVLKKSLPLMLATQIYPAVPWFLWQIGTLSLRKAFNQYEQLTVSQDQVSISNEARSPQLDARFIDLEDDIEFLRYLGLEDASLPEETLKQFRPLFGEKETLVAVKITQPPEGVNLFGVHLTYPQENPAFPREFSCRNCRKTLYVKDYVKPSLTSEIQPNYYVDPKVVLPPTLKTPETYSEFRYTKIVLNNPQATGHMRLTPQGPQVFIPHLVAAHPKMTMVFVFILLSVLASLICGQIVYRGGVSTKDLIALGCLNLLSILGVIWGVTRIRKHAKKQHNHGTLFKLFIFIPLVYTIPLILLMLLSALTVQLQTPVTYLLISLPFIFSAVASIRDYQTNKQTPYLLSLVLFTIPVFFIILVYLFSGGMENPLTLVLPTVFSLVFLPFLVFCWFGLPLMFYAGIVGSFTQGEETRYVILFSVLFIALCSGFTLLYVA
ncbi:MAG: hypothetical protein GF334_11780 [Candidatus Altiarchaeales archaeon]|nr:hypothetical protein [Candidatus Altiarchaeales archaeon]